MERSCDLTEEYCDEFTENDWNYFVADVTRMVQVTSCGIEPTEEAAQIVACRIVGYLREVLTRAVHQSQTERKRRKCSNDELPINLQHVLRALNNDPVKQSHLWKTWQKIRQLNAFYKAF